MTYIPLPPLSCVDCDVDTRAIAELYMVHPALWELATGQPDGINFIVEPSDFFLCIGCLEHRIGRTLNNIDFIPCPLNTDEHRRRSERLLDRLTRGLPDVRTLRRASRAG